MVKSNSNESTTFRCGVTRRSAPNTYSYATVTVRPGGTGTAELQFLVNHLIGDWHDVKLLETDQTERCMAYLRALWSLREPTHAVGKAT